MLRIINDYIDPHTKAPLYRDEKGNLFESNNSQKIAYENHEGVYDFVKNKDKDYEKDHYNNLYKKNISSTRSIKDLQQAWEKEPGFKQLLKSMGDISTKKILLLGNGISIKEFYLLKLGAKCVYTDLSIEAVEYMKSLFEQSELKRCGFDQIEFHAVNALKLPFPDEFFDIIYGCAFVHHIEKKDELFSEISRCLKTGGICRFLDHAYSPLWQGMKNTILKPIQLYSHEKHGISPSDLIFTKRGGFKIDELEQLKEKFGFKKMLYRRVAFCEHLLQRGTLKMGGKYLRKIKPLMKALDTFCDKTVSLVKKHGIVLVWGFTK